MAGRLRLPAIAVPLRLPDAVSRRLGDAFCFVGPHGELDAVSRSELGHQAGDMELDCAHADVKLGADLGIRASPGHREQNSFLAFGQSFNGLDSYGITRARREAGE